MRIASHDFGTNSATTPRYTPDVPIADPMRIVVHDYGGYPFSVHLARSLAARQHEVLYLHSTGFVTPKGPMVRRENDPPGLTIEGVGIDEDGRRSAGARRLIQERRYGERLAQRIAAWHPAAVISANCPLDAQSTALAASHSVGAGFVFWMQDYYSHAVRRLLERRIPLIGRLIGTRFARLEGRLLRSADAVVPVSSHFLPVLESWGIPQHRISLVQNWAPLETSTVIPKDNEWSREHGVNQVPVLAYMGTLGRKHNPALLLALARSLATTTVMVVSEGVGTDWLRRHADVPNLVMLPLQPADRLPEVLASADVLVALLENDAAEFSEPSKVLTYLAAGRPILAAIPAVNPTAKTLQRIGAGLVVEPDDIEGLVDGARSLLERREDREAAGANGRAYALREFDIGRITDKFESILTAVRGRPSRPAPSTRSATDH